MRRKEFVRGGDIEAGLFDMAGPSTWTRRRSFDAAAPSYLTRTGREGTIIAQW
jgi:hypothetical protein